MADFSSTASFTLDASQWAAESKKAAKGTKKLTDETSRLADISEKSEKRLRKEAKQAKRLAAEEKRLADAKNRTRIAYAAVAVAALATFRIVKRSVELFQEQERAERQVAAAIKSTGAAAGLTLLELKALATEQQRLTGIGDELTLQYQAILLTFTKIGRDVFPQASRAIADMSVRLGLDLTSAAILVGKALNDPILGVTALSRSGIQFTVSQKAVIKSLVETGDVAAAQALILKELEIQFGGSAEAARKDSAVFAAALGDVGEVIGRNLDPAIQGVSRSLTTLAEKMIEFLEPGINVDQLIQDLTKDTEAWWKVNREENLTALESRMRELQAQMVALKAEAAGGPMGQGFGGASLAQRKRVEEVTEAIRLLQRQMDEAPLQVLIDVQGAEEAKQILKEIREAEAEALEQAKFRLEDQNALIKAAQENVRALTKEHRERLGAIQDELDLLRQIEALNEAAPLPFTEDDLLAVAKAAAGGLEEGAQFVSEAILTGGDDVAATWKDVIVSGGREVGAGWADVLGALASTIARIAQDFGRREQGQLGGNLSGDFGSEGGQIGAVIGGIVGGGPLGAAIGEALGGIIGGAIKQGADEGLASLRQIADDVAIQITRDQGGLGGIALQIGQAFNDALAGVESILRGQIDIAGFDIKIRDDVISIFINGITGTFDNIRDAVSFALSESLRTATLFNAGAGASPEVIQALQAFAAGLTDDLGAALALAVRNEKSRIGPAAAAVTDTVREIMDRLFESIRLGIDASGPLADLERQRNALLGIQEEVGAVKAAEIEAFNAEILIRQAGLQALLAELQARGTATVAFSEIAAAQIGAENVRIQAMGAQTNATIQMASLTAEATATAIAALNALEGLFIDPAAARRAIADARRAGRRAAGAGRAGGGAVSDPTASLREQLERLRIGSDETALAIFEHERAMAALAEQRAASTLTQQEQLELVLLLEAQFREEQIRLATEARDAILDPWREILQDNSFSGQLDQLRESARAAIEALGDGGLMTNLTDLALIERAAAIEAAALGEELQDAFRSTIGGVIGLLQQNLQFITDPAEREQIEALILQMQQDELRLKVDMFRLAIMQHELDLAAFGLLNEASQAWIDGMLAGLDIVEANFGTIFQGFEDAIVGAGQQFAGTIQSAAGMLGGIVPLMITNMEAFLALILSPPRTAAEVEASEGLQLAQLLFRIEQLTNPQAGLSPGEALMQMVLDLEPFFESFGLSFEEITAQVQGIIDAETIEDMGRSMQALIDLQQSLLPGGALSGDSDIERLVVLKAQILSAMARGDFDEAARLGQEAISIASGVSGAWLADIRSLILGLDTGLTGTVTGTGGTGTQVEPFADQLNAFERGAADRHLTQEQNRFEIAAVEIEQRDEIIRLLAQGPRAPRRGNFTDLRARPQTQTLLSRAVRPRG